MQSYGMEWGAQADFKTILEQVSSDDIMFVYEGVSQLRVALNVAEEKSLARFPTDPFCQKLVHVLKQPVIMEEISNEIKLMAVQSLASILDIFPQHTSYLVQLGVTQAVKDTLNQSVGYIELVEQCIKLCEKISLDHPAAVNQSCLLPQILDTYDFFDQSTQTKILNLLLNICSSSESAADFEANLMPVVPIVCNMLSQTIFNETDRLKVEKVSTIFYRLTNSFARFDGFEKVGALFDQLSNAGVHETILEGLLKFSQSQSQPDEINTVQTFSDQTISNFLRVLQVSADFSHQVVMQMTSFGILDILSPLLPRTADQECTPVVHEVITLLEHMLPATEEPTEQVQKNYETEKQLFFKNQDNTLHTQIAKSLLPKIFIAYNQEVNNSFKAKCLSLIQSMLMITPQSLLAECFDPATFTKFIHMILKQQQPQQVLCCLRTVWQLIETGQGERLSDHFSRHGIKEIIIDFTQPAVIEQLNKLQIKQPRQSMFQDKAAMLGFAIQDRERVVNRIKAMSQLSENCKGPKKEELDRVIAKYEDTVKALDYKIIELRALTTGEPKAEQTDYGTQVADIANKIKTKYFDQVECWQKLDNQWLIELTSLAKQLHTEAAQHSFNQESCQSVMQALAQALTSDSGITSFEFYNSGLLNSVQMVLTMSATEAVELMDNQFEESKVQNPQQLSKQEAESYVLRLKQFVDCMCQRTNNRLPFKQLFLLCHDQLTLAEPMILNETSSDHSEVMHLMNRGLIINLVYDKEAKLPFQQLGHQPSKVHEKRDLLYNQLKELPLNILKSDNVSLLEDFLLKRIKTAEDVAALLQQTQRHFRGFKPDNGKDALYSLDAELEPLFDRLMERMADHLEESTSEDVFHDLQASVVLEMVGYIKDFEQSSAKPIDDQFYKYLAQHVQKLIAEMASEEQQDMEEQNVPEDEMELILETVAVKTASFLKLISIIQQTAKELKQDKAEVQQLSNSQEETPTEAVPNKINVAKKQHLIPTQSIDELLKQQDDVVIEFYYNGKQINANTSFFEICQEPTKEKPPQTKDLMMMHMTSQEFRTIHFTIRDRLQTEVPDKAQRKDSLVELAQARQRTESQFVDQIAAQSVNTLVQSLLTKFQVKSVTVKTLEHALKVLKVLEKIYSDTSMFTAQGINFLLGSKREFATDDLTVMQLQTEKLQFHHAKLDFNFQKAIADPYQVVQGGINETLKVIFNSCTFLFSFETKLLYLKLVSLISVDVQRSMQYLRQHLKQNKRPMHEERKEKQIERQKIKVERGASLVVQCQAFVNDIKKRAILEINFQNEEGTGLGPTLEFYSMLAQEIQADTTLWRKDAVNNALYPRSLQVTAENQEQVRAICDKFSLMGTMIAKSILDDRLINLPLSPLMWDLVFDCKMNLFSLKYLDAGLYALFSELQLMANRRLEIEQEEDIELRLRLLSQVKSSKGVSIEDYDLSFYNPSDETIELVKNGGNLKVTLLNLQTYIDLVIDSTFNESIRMQINAFKRGFNKVMPIGVLSIFKAKELDTLVCGEGCDMAAEWTDVNRLSELINTAHGYSNKSGAFLMFLRYIAELEPKSRSQFVQFLTGSARLPVGGFGALEPRLTVVLKRPEVQAKLVSDQILPSVMTCQNYLKMPEYSSFEVLKAKFDMAVAEGSQHFGLA